MDLENLYAKKIYTDMLIVLKKRADEQKIDALILAHLLKKEYGYPQEEVDSAREHLVMGGFINPHGYLKLTEDGSNYIKDIIEFRMLSCPGKITAIVRKNFTEIISLYSLLISVAALLISIFK